MATADIQLYDGFTFSPVLHLDEFGEDAFHIIEQAFDNAAGLATRFHVTIDRFFGSLIKNTGQYLDAAESDALVFTVFSPYRLLRELGKQEGHYGSFVVLIQPDDPIRLSHIIYSGNLSSQAEEDISHRRTRDALGVTGIEPLKSLNDEIIRMKKKQNEWKHSDEKSWLSKDIPSDLWRFREMEKRRLNDEIIRTEKKLEKEML